MYIQNAQLQACLIGVFIEERACIQVKSETNIKLQKSVKHALKVLSSIYKIWPTVSLTCQNVNSEIFTFQIHVFH